MSFPARLRVVREFHTGPAVVRDLAGPVVRVPLGPRLVVPPFVLVTSPQGAHDVLAGSSNDTMDKLTQIHRETRLIGDNVFNLPYEALEATATDAAAALHQAACRDLRRSHGHGGR